MTKRKEKPQMATNTKAMRSYRDAAKMLARLERGRRFHAQPYGRKTGPRARKLVLLELFPKEWAVFLGMLAVGIVLNGDKTRDEMMAIISGKMLPDATRPKGKSK